MLRKPRVWLALAGMLLLGFAAQAQEAKKTGATLMGTVLDASGKPVANAGVTCESSGGRAPHAAHTDGKGRFVISGLKPDSYDVKASASGYSSGWQRNIPLRKGQTKDITLKLVNDNDAKVVKIPAPRDPPKDQQ